MIQMLTCFKTYCFPLNALDVSKSVKYLSGEKAKETIIEAIYSYRD